MMAYELKNIAILNVQGVDYRCILWSLSKNGAINSLNSSKLDDRGTLQTWILVQLVFLVWILVLRCLFWY